MTESRIRRRIVVSGRVQGVWFRQSTAERAAAIGVAGWVRNLADGDVEAVFEGTPDLVDEAVAYVSVGPSRARVDHVRTWDEAPEGLAGFAVR